MERTVYEDDELVVLIVGNQDQFDNEKKERKSLVERKPRKRRAKSGSKVQTNKKKKLVEESASSSSTYSVSAGTGSPSLKVSVEIEQVDTDDEVNVPKSTSNDDSIANDVKPGPRKRRKTANPPTHRMTLLPPGLHKSFVSDLRRQDPQLQEDKELLIETLSGIMANTKCPTPPPDFLKITEGKFECGECGVKKDTEMALARHWQERHGPRYLICYSCGADFRSLGNLFKHEKRCDSADALIVLKARARFKKCKRTCPGRPFHLPDYENESYVNFLRQCHPEEAKDREFLINKLCDKMMLEIPPEPINYCVETNDMFQCTGCGVEMKSKTGLARHWQSMHGPRYLNCYACSSDFRDSGNLYKHEKRCTGRDASLVLEARARTLAQRGHERPGFLKIKSKFKSQIPVRNKPETFKCDVCPAEFKLRKSLNAHALSHFGSRPYICDVCPAAYCSSNALYRHKQSHQDLTFLCDQCDRTFNTKSALRSHMYVHLPPRKFPCPECGKVYAQRPALRIHIDRDHKQLPPPHACQICPKRYPKMSLLKDHMLKKHGMRLITKNTLHKALPYLSKSQLLNATIVKKSGVESMNLTDIVGKNKDTNTEPTETETEEIIQEIECEVVQDDQIMMAEESDHDNETVDVNHYYDDDQMSEENNDATTQDTPAENVDGAQTGLKNEEQDSFETDINDDEENPPNELLEYAKALQLTSHASSTKPLVVIKDGQAIFLDKNNIDFYKKKMVEDNSVQNSNIELYKKKIVSEMFDVEESETELPPESLLMERVKQPLLRMKTRQKDEIISKTNRVVTLKNCIVSPQNRQSPVAKAKKGKRKRTQYFR